jgi:MSHA pilin protein MshD
LFPGDRHARGVTLVETILAVALSTFAAGALLTALSSSVQVSTDCLHIAIANGLADQLMDEIASVKFPPGISNSGAGRSGFDDIDDYDGYSISPPQARSGLVIGTEGTSTSGSLMYRPQSLQPDPHMLNRYRQQVLVEKIAESSGNQWVVVPQSTTYRRVTVAISYTDAQGKTTPLAIQTRVFSNVAIAP